MAQEQGTALQSGPVAGSGFEEAALAVLQTHTQRLTPAMQELQESLEHAPAGGGTMRWKPVWKWYVMSTHVLHATFVQQQAMQKQVLGCAASFQWQQS